MMAGVDLQVVWNESKGAVQMFIGDFRIDLPPVLCEQLEKELAAARRVPERAWLMANCYVSRASERQDCAACGVQIVDNRQAQDDRDIAAWGGDPSVCM